MRYSQAAIRRILSDHKTSGLSVAAFCRRRQLKPATVYNWIKKYGHSSTEPASGFHQIKTVAVTPSRSLLLPGGLRIELTGLTMAELAQLILEINRAHA